MNKKIFVLLAAFLMLSVSTYAAPPKREFRSVWISGLGIDWPSSKTEAGAKSEMDAYLDKFENMGLTGVCIHVRPRADAFYKSTLEPWAGDLTGTRGKDPGWDPLEYVVAECHKRGLECYAWVNPFRISSSGTSYMTTSFDKEWSSKGWLLTGSNGTWIAFNPAIPEVRRHILDVFKEIYSNYDIDGMVFDDYFYPNGGTPEDSSAEDYSMWQSYRSSGGTMSLADWRRNNVNEFVKAAYDEIQAARPDMRFGIGPAGAGHATATQRGLRNPSCSASDWQYDGIYADCLEWLEAGTVDFMAPQLYWSTTHSSNPFGPMTEWWSYATNHYNRHCYVSPGIYHLVDGQNSFTVGDKAEMTKEINYCRQYTLNNSSGQIYFKASTFNNTTYNFDTYIKQNSYTQKSLTPVVTWKTRVSYPAVSNLSYSSGKLSWTATNKTGRAIVRYTVYAVPVSVEYTDALASDDDGIDSKYLLGVTYDPSYTIPSAKRSGYWYAVCVFDGYGYESDPSVYGLSLEPSPATTLISPKNGVVVGWEPELKWNAVSNVFYTVQVATDSQFLSVLTEKANLTTTSTTISLDGTTDGQLLYWRVMTKSEGLKATYSEVETFRAPTRTAAPKATLTSPANNAQIETQSVSFAWSVSSSAAASISYRLEIAGKGSNFSSLKYSQEIPAGTTTCSVATSALGVGNYDWRIVSKGDRYSETVSATRSFSVTKLVVGLYEDGYLVKTDDATYAPVDGITLKNLWFRSVANPWNNFSQLNSGKLNRGMVAYGDKVYVSGRDEESTDATCFVQVYDGNTGEHLNDILVWDSKVQVSYRPCNDIAVDDNGNLCIANMSINLGTTPFYIHKINDDGSATQLVSYTGNSGERVDHFAVFGDLTSDFYWFAAIKGTGTVLRQRVTNGVAGTVKRISVSDFYPASSSSFGIAPKVHPISADQFYVDGSLTAWTLYNSNGTMLSSFSENLDAAPQSFTGNGGRTFKLGNEQYMVYSYTGEGDEQGVKFAVAKTKSANSFKNMHKLWVFPANGMGTVNSSTCSEPVDVVVTSDSTAIIYVYSVGNGLAAYSITKQSTTGVESINDSADDVDIVVDGNTVRFSAVVPSVEVFSMTGVLVATANDTDAVELSQAGAYIVKCGRLTKLVIVK